MRNIDLLRQRISIVRIEQFNSLFLLNQAFTRIRFTVARGAVGRGARVPPLDAIPASAAPLLAGPPQ